MPQNQPAPAPLQNHSPIPAEKAPNGPESPLNSADSTRIKPDSNALFTKEPYKEVYESTLALNSEGWLREIEKMNLDSFATELAVKSVVLEQNQQGLVLGVDEKDEKFIDEFNFNALKKGVWAHFQQSSKKNASDWHFAIKVLQLHCKRPKELLEERKRQQFESKMSELMASEDFQTLAQHFKHLKIVDVVNIPDQSKQKTTNKS